MSFRAACVQLCSSDDVDENIRVASDLVREARAAGADFIATPENTTLMAPDGGAKLEKSHEEDHDPALPRFRALAEELGVWLLIGLVIYFGYSRKHSVVARVVFSDLERSRMASG